MITIVEFEPLIDAVTDDGLDACAAALIKAQQQFESTPNAPRALDRRAAIWYAINCAGRASFKIEDAHYVFIWPLICLRHRSNIVSMMLMKMIGQTIDRALRGTRSADERVPSGIMRNSECPKCHNAQIDAALDREI